MVLALARKIANRFSVRSIGPMMKHAIVNLAVQVWGLAIVETAIQQHRGWVKAEDSPLGGLRLVIWLPLYKRS